jgi:HSP20 family molecular chaperone IbpA
MMKNLTLQQKLKGDIFNMIVDNTYTGGGIHFGPYTIPDTNPYDWPNIPLKGIEPNRIGGHTFSIMGTNPQSATVTDSEDGNHVVYSYDIPGVSADEVTAYVEDDALIVEAYNDNRSYHFSNHLHYDYGNDVEHKLENGVLTISVPVVRRRINILESVKPTLVENTEG